MGWNELAFAASATIRCWPGIGHGSHAYYVHSFELRPADTADLLATADYGGKLTAAVGRDNLIGTQFHPEKSQAAGLRLIANFLRWRP